jgi:hypothetical protein
VADVFTDVFKYQSNVKNVARAADSEGPIEKSDVTSYFVDEDKQEPVDRATITS